MIIYVENPRIRENVEVIHVIDQSKVAGYKRKVQSQFLFYILAMNKWNWKQINTIPFTLAPKNEILRYKSNKIGTRSI